MVNYCEPSNKTEWIVCQKLNGTKIYKYISAPGLKGGRVLPKWRG